MKKHYGFYFALTLFSHYSFALPPLTICSTATGTNFSAGDGSATNPYVICNAQQFNRIGQEKLLSQSFVLGSDIDFQSQPLVQIGSATNAYTGNFDGKGYSLRSISFTTNTGSNIAPFASINNAQISNVIIDGITISQNGGIRRAGLVAFANNSTLTNNHILNYNIACTDNSGGLVGEINNTTISHCSAQGIIRILYGADAVGGLVGNATNSRINTSSTNVVMIPNDNQNMNSTSALGGFAGAVSSTQIEDVFAFINIDFSNIKVRFIPDLVGGLIGMMINQSNLNRAYVVGPIKGLMNEGGAAVGAFQYQKKSIPVNVVFWNSDVSTIQTSGVGIGINSETMGTPSFWLGNGFSDTIWVFKEGQYPYLQ